MAIARGRLLWRGTAAKVTIAALVPLVLLGVGIWRFFPASEYIIGGKDPGVYVNEGIAIDRTGQLFRRDAVVAERAGGVARSVLPLSTRASGTTASASWACSSTTRRRAR